MDGSNAKDNTAVRCTLGSALLCSNTTLKLEADPDDPTREKWTPRGNSSEAPLVVGACKVGRCKLDPNLKAHPVSKFDSENYNGAFNLNLVSQLAPLQQG